MRIESAMQDDDAQPILNSQLSTLNFPSTLNFLIVPNPLKALQKLAEVHRERFNIPVIGITGKQWKNHCERVVAPIAESGPLYRPFSA